jgi:hypothetical protein
MNPEIARILQRVDHENNVVAAFEKPFVHEGAPPGCGGAPVDVAERFPLSKFPNLRKFQAVPLEAGVWMPL